MVNLFKTFRAESKSESQLVSIIIYKTDLTITTRKHNLLNFSFGITHNFQNQICRKNGRLTVPKFTTPWKQMFFFRATEVVYFAFCTKLHFYHVPFVFVLKLSRSLQFPIPILLLSFLSADLNVNDMFIHSNKIHLF